MYGSEMRETTERIVVDASVVSGMFDENEHPKRVKPFWDAVFERKIRVVLSDVLDGEVKNAPQLV